MANQIIVTQSGNVQVSIQPTPNVQVQISRAAIGTVSNVPTANFANYAGNVTVSAQPNITSLGTLTGLTVSGNSTVNNLTVTGNLVAGNLVANSANFANFAGEAFNVSGSNVTGAVANATYANNANTANSATVANTANSVALANVSGAGNIASINLDGNVANLLTGLGTFVAIPTVSANANYANFANIANTANSVAVANVSGIGNIATVNLDGNASNILFGNGIFSAIPAVSNVANANYANFAGTAFNVSGSNVSGEVANAAYANIAGVANSVAGANVSGAVAYATVANSVSVGNVSGIGNISTINIDGNLGNVLYGNGVFAAVVAPTSVANANYANFAGTAYSVSGSNVSGEVANAAYANAANTANTANLATFATTANSVAGANVSGTVANATFALDAGNSNLANTANSVAVANVSGIGNIATVNLDGNASNILYGNGVFATTPIISNVANANYANFAGTAFSVSGSNVSGEVANAAYANAANTANLASFATTANSVAGANVSGEVANANFASYANIASSANSVALANVSGIGNIANINLDGSSSNVLFGNGVFAPESTSIANANYANFAGTAFNVSGSNVSGEVANANYASYANVANTANSVAVGNVSGIGNIATINLDGNASNALLGNGSFGPVEVQSTSIANGTSNINIPTASSNILFSTAGNANVVDIQAIGTFNVKPPAQGPLSAIRIDTYGRSGNVGAQRIASFRYRGNSTTPLSVQPGDYTLELLTVGSNGTAAQTNSVAVIRAQVDSSYTANGANIPLGWQIVVNDTNGGTNNQTKNHNFYANGNVTFAQYVNATGYFGDGGNLSNLTGANVTGQVPYANVANSVAVANVSGIGNIATINLDGNSSNVLFGNGVFAPESTSIANANYANFAGQVVDATQSNITSVGNLVSLNVVNSANVTGTIQQLAPNTITISTNTTINTAYDLTTIYGETSNIVESGQRAIIRSRGNISTPATVVSGDIGTRDRVYFYNGTTNALGFSTSVQLSNLNSNSNAYTTGANYNISVGNPNGDQGNASAASALNLLQFNQNGQLLLLPGANSSIGSMLNMFNYGQPANLSTAQGITMSRARGNRDANLSVQANDQIGRLVFQAHNGTSFVTNRLPILRATVDGNYTANTANIPAGFQMITCDNTTSYTHNFYANGATLFGGNLVSLNVTGNISANGLSTSGEVGLSGNGSVQINGSSNGTPRSVFIGDFTTGNMNVSVWGNFSQTFGNFAIGSPNIFLYNGGNSFVMNFVTGSGNTSNINGVTNISATGNISAGGDLSVSGALSIANLQAANLQVGNFSSPSTQTASLWAETNVKGNLVLNGSNTKMQFGFGNISLQILDGNVSIGNANGNGGSLDYFTSRGRTQFYMQPTGNSTTIDMYAANGYISTTGTVSAANVAVTSNGFMKLAVYTEAALTAITGQVGWMAAVSDSAQGSNPNGMIAFWDTTNSRWSYIHDNSAV